MRKPEIAAVLIVLCAVVAFAMLYRGEILASNQAVKPYDDVRTQVAWNGETPKDLTKVPPAELKELIPTLWFNQDTVWPEGSKAAADKALEDAKNPGLGVRALHKQGITGKGVNVAIIDQPVYDDHPEFKGKVAAYKNLCTPGEGSESSMHGPAVLSLLAGRTTGTAPGVNVYFAAAPSWTADAVYQAKALDWIVEQNAKLPRGKKIRVVSVSAAPSGLGSPFKKNNDQWDFSVERAEKAGILVLDCTRSHGIIGMSFFEGDRVWEDPVKCLPGFPAAKRRTLPEKFLEKTVLVPTSPRTTAEEYERGKCSYQYTGQGGLSWAIPYAAGVLAMGWQVRPELTREQMVDLLMKSAYKKDGAKYIDPPAFIRMVKGFKR